MRAGSGQLLPRVRRHAFRRADPRGSRRLTQSKRPGCGNVPGCPPAPGAGDKGTTGSPSRTDRHTSLFYVRALEKGGAHDGAFCAAFARAEEGEIFSIEPPSGSETDRRFFGGRAEIADGRGQGCRACGRRDYQQLDAPIEPIHRSALLPPTLSARALPPSNARFPARAPCGRAFLGPAHRFPSLQQLECPDRADPSKRSTSAAPFPARATCGRAFRGAGTRIPTVARRRLLAP